MSASSRANQNMIDDELLQLATHFKNVIDPIIKQENSLLQRFKVKIPEWWDDQKNKSAPIRELGEAVNQLIDDIQSGREPPQTSFSRFLSLRHSFEQLTLKQDDGLILRLRTFAKNGKEDAVLDILSANELVKGLRALIEDLNQNTRDYVQSEGRLSPEEKATLQAKHATKKVLEEYIQMLPENHRSPEERAKKVYKKDNLRDALMKELANLGTVASMSEAVDLITRVKSQFTTFIKGVDTSHGLQAGKEGEQEKIGKKLFGFLGVDNTSREIRNRYMDKESGNNGEQRLDQHLQLLKELPLSTAPRARR